MSRENADASISDEINADSAMFLPNIDADADNYLFVEGRAALRHGLDVSALCWPR
jgi:hypothetical protein